MNNTVYKKWHDILDMPKKNEQWHKEDIADEYVELDEARGPINRWSEYSPTSCTPLRVVGGMDIL